MKKTIMIISLFCFVLQSVGQDSRILSNDVYLKKSKKQKRTGWIMLGSGAAMIAVGVPLMAHGQRQEGFMGGLGEELGGLALTAGGGALSLSSIPVFIASSRNKRKSATVSGSLQMGRAPVMYMAGLSMRAFPALALRLQWP